MLARSGGKSRTSDRPAYTSPVLGIVSGQHHPLVGAVLGIELGASCMLLGTRSTNRATSSVENKSFGS